MRIMGIDASTKSTGWSIFDGGRLETYGCITATSSDVFKRIHKIASEIGQLLDENKIDKIIIEDILPASVGNNIDVYKKLTFLQGFLLDEFHKREIPYEYVVASHWRKKCGLHTGKYNKRTNLKQQSIEFVKEKWGSSVNDDIADSICIAYSAAKDEELAF